MTCVIHHVLWPALPALPLPRRVRCEEKYCWLLATHLSNGLDYKWLGTSLMWCKYHWRYRLLIKKEQRPYINARKVLSKRVFTLSFCTKGQPAYHQLFECFYLLKIQVKRKCFCLLNVQIFKRQLSPGTSSLLLKVPGTPGHRSCEKPGSNGSQHILYAVCLCVYIHTHTVDPRTI